MIILNKDFADIVFGAPPVAAHVEAPFPKTQGDK